MKVRDHIHNTKRILRSSQPLDRKFVEYSASRHMAIRGGAGKMIFVLEAFVASLVIFLGGLGFGVMFYIIRAW